MLVGKWVVAYLPPYACVYFFGFTLEATFLRGVYDKLGIESQVVKFGKKREDLKNFINEGVYQVKRLEEDDFITTVLYDYEVCD
ncbi:hypothetical protein KIW84_041525 [Lathyrus oleraceus]|uniref:Uncharacterized protein n=1 Tax=Pisum sativum TaxID=3888 RepID=A0A9D5ARP9_PEA|nr:hypothetical protein KIW84_041525 [Pisum sativum]